MFVMFRRWPRHRADHSSGEALHVLVWSKKYLINSLIPSSDRSWLCKGPGGVGRVNVPLRGRLNLDNEMRITILRIARKISILDRDINPGL